MFYLSTKHPHLLSKLVLQRKACANALLLHAQLRMEPGRAHESTLEALALRMLILTKSYTHQDLSNQTMAY